MRHHAYVAATVAATALALAGAMPAHAAIKPNSEPPCLGADCHYVYNDVRPGSPGIGVQTARSVRGTAQWIFNNEAYTYWTWNSPSSDVFGKQMVLGAWNSIPQAQNGYHDEDFYVYVHCTMPQNWPAGDRDAVTIYLEGGGNEPGAHQRRQISGTVYCNGHDQRVNLQYKGQGASNWNLLYPGFYSQDVHPFLVEGFNGPKTNLSLTLYAPS